MNRTGPYRSRVVAACLALAMAALVATAHADAPTATAAKMKAYPSWFYGSSKGSSLS